MLLYWLLNENRVPFDLNKNWINVKGTVIKFLDKCILYVKKTHNTYNTKEWLVSHYKVILKTGAKIKGLKEKEYLYHSNRFFDILCLVHQLMKMNWLPKSISYTKWQIMKWNSLIILQRLICIYFSSFNYIKSM